MATTSPPTAWKFSISKVSVFSRTRGSEVRCDFDVHLPGEIYGLVSICISQGQQECCVGGKRQNLRDINATGYVESDVGDRVGAAMAKKN